MNMAKYSINLGAEYKTLEKLNDVKQYFAHRHFDDRYTKEIGMLEQIEQTLIDKILEAVRIWSAAMLLNKDTEFDL